MKTKTAVLNGKPKAGNPHIRFDEGEVASVKPRHGSLLYRRCALKKTFYLGVAAFTTFGMSALAETEFSARSYVQNGLVIQYDAIDNDGTGVHNPAATVWKNLTGFGGQAYDCNLLAAGSWGEDNRSFVCDGTGAAAAPGSSSTYAPFYHTGEACFTRTSGDMMLTAAGTPLRRMFVFSGANLAFVGNNTQTVAAKSVPYDSIQQYAVTYGGDLVDKVYRNGAELGADNLASYKASRASDGGLVIGDRKPNKREGGYTPFKGCIHTIRLYDRALTDGELLFNANIDKIRYEDADPATLTWPSDCRWNATDKCFEFFVKVSLVTDEGGSVAVTGVPDEGAWLAEGSEVRFKPTAAAGKMFGGIDGCLCASRQDGDDVVITVRPGLQNWNLRAVFNDRWAYPFPKDGLVVDLDASRPDTMTIDADGRVSSWQSMVGGVAFVNDVAASSPIYDATRNGGHGVWFGCDDDFDTGVPTWLVANSQKTTRTVILVFNLYKNVLSSNAMWGFIGNDEVLYCSGRWNLQWGGASRSLFYRSILSGAVSYENGTPCLVKTSASERLTLANGDNQNIFFQVEATDAFFSDTYSCKNALINVGTTSHAFAGGGVRIIQLQEVLIYDRVLSQSEREFITRTLREKWGTPTVSYPASLKNRVKVWTNASGDDDWGNSANWLGGIPASNEVAVVEGATAKVKTTASFTSDLKFLDGASLDIAGGTVKLEEKSTIDLPASTTVSGGSIFVGGGMVRFNGDVSADTLTVYQSTFDLNGHDMTVRSLTGGNVTNSSASASTLSVEPTDTAAGYLSAFVREGVTLARGGSEKQECVFAGNVDGSSGTIFGAGLTRVDPVRASNALSTGPAVFAAGAALDLAGTTQMVAKASVAGDAAVMSGALLPKVIETEVADDGSFGALSLDLGLDLADIDFAFIGGKPRPSNKTILTVNEQVVGSFKSVYAPMPDEIRYRARKVTYGAPGILLIVR